MKYLNSVYKIKHLKYVNKLYESKKISLNEKKDYIKNIDKYIKRVRKNRLNESHESHVYLWKSKTPSDIKLSVGLPLYKSSYIVKLALESLKNQSLINFDWELVIHEESSYSLGIIKSFIGKLPNCKRIYYKKSKGITNIPITTKWINIAKDCSKTSTIFVLQAADDYSPTKRLYQHYEHFKNKNCLLSTQGKCIFYNMKNKKSITYDYKNRGGIHVNNAILKKDMLLMIDLKKYKGLHAFILQSIKTHNKINGTYIYYTDKTDNSNWMTGFCTDGYNTITTKRARLYNNPSDMYRKNTYNLKKSIPSYIYSFITK
jgi:hypothetical protein